MFETWLFHRKKRPEPLADLPLLLSGPDSASRLMEGGPLDLLGQQSESVRDRVNNLAERLHDLQSLSVDFGQIVGPLNGFMEQHAASRARLMEVEALLEREREISKANRTELDKLQLSHAKMSGELQDAIGKTNVQMEAMRLQDGQLAELRLRVAELKSKAESLDDRLFAESERSKALVVDNAALRADVASAEDAAAQANRHHAEAREMLSIAEAERLRLQAITESMAPKLAGLSRSVSELDAQLQAARGFAAELQGKLAAEQSSRQKIETLREAERSSSDLQRAALAMKIDGLEAHIVSTDKLLAHLREQLNDKSEAFRSTEKTLREALGEKAALERRLETALDAANRLGAQGQDMQRTNAELSDRAEMLTKAVAAKEQALEGANRKTASLLERIDQLTNRFQQERSDFEMAHRRVIEELQSERAERSMAQGALDIARKSRATLLARYSTLKRQSATASSRSGEDDDTIGGDMPKSEPSNVMSFSPQD